ncbi:uncharacterized protein LOC116778465 [Danaus plexippus]|uniref:uncharacterized protein LOC116778465 n=1 Tax=Danaus plexippus TaxID=13037 RepID=UPI002AB236B2|nr:uncharacterized protein LOC116778465 [Danaus plexippus]
MAFSFRKMLSNINYFKKSDESPSNDPNLKRRRHTYMVEDPIINFEEADSTSRQCTSLKLPESLKNYAAKKGSLSDTDLLTLSVEVPTREKRRKKLKLDIKKASQSMNQLSTYNVENTPKHVHLECKSSEAFSERFRGFDFKTLDLFDAMYDERDTSSPLEEEIDIHSLSDHSDTDISIKSSNSSIKMCRKVNESSSSNDKIVPSTSLESFGDVELEKSEEERIRLLLNYQMKLDKMESVMKRLLHEFQFHIEVSKVFHSKSVVTALQGSNIHKTLEDITNIEKNANWNFIVEREDDQTKYKLKKQLLSIKSCIDNFVRIYLNIDKQRLLKKPIQKTHKKKKHFDFPDLRDALLNLFSLRNDSIDDDSSKCECNCHNSSPDSDLESASSKTDQSLFITSSIGNFTLDCSTLTAYSESLDQVISYTSYEDSSLFNSLLQKAAIERITFYIQVHSIQLSCEQNESKNIIFHCPPCQYIETEESDLLCHILSQEHCEKIHFLYKTAYIKKCMSAGKEIQPSTVLNPMRMYRDENKIVCFGDALYACTLCFENLIIGESVLMAHCSEPQHISRREKLGEIID